MSRRPPAPAFDLPAWDPRAWEAWERKTERVRHISRRAGGGRHFDALVTEARKLLDAGDEPAVVARLGSRRFARAVATAWSADADLAQRTMSRTLLAAFRSETAPRPSRLTTIALARVLLAHFDHLDRWADGLFADLAHTVRGAVSAQPERAPDVVEVLRSEGSYLLDPQGPRTLARHLLSTGTDLRAWLRGHHLATEEDTRFARLARDAHYLVQIEDCDPEHGDHAFLRAIAADAVARQKSEQQAGAHRYFGHDVLEALTAKSSRRPSQAWVDALIAIGGDPRRRQTDRWDLWWGRVHERALAQSLRWMSGADLGTFLDAVEQYGREKGNTDLNRMLEPRRTFLMGLYESDRIRETRLVLGADIARKVARSAIDAARYVEPNNQSTAIVILDCGDFTLVEGSHNFRLYLFTGPPVASLMDLRKRHFVLDDFREKARQQHAERDPAGASTAISHNGLWQRGALDFLRRRGIAVDERALVTPNTYAAIQRRRAAEGLLYQ